MLTPNRFVMQWRSWLNLLRCGANLEVRGHISLTDISLTATRHKHGDT